MKHPQGLKVAAQRNVYTKFLLFAATACASARREPAVAMHHSRLDFGRLKYNKVCMCELHLSAHIASARAVGLIVLLRHTRLCNVCFQQVLTGSCSGPANRIAESILFALPA